MTTTSPTPLRQLADFLLREKGGLEDFVQRRRADGRSWRVIARDLYLATEGQADVSNETLRGWFPELDETAPAASDSDAGTAA